MRRVRILFFVEAMGGGVFTYITNLANNLSDKFDVYVAYAVRPQTPKDYAHYFNKNVKLIEVNNFQRKISFKDIKAFFEMRNIYKAVKPDIIHLHSSKAGVLGRWAFNGEKIPLFYTPHGYSFLMSNISPLKEKIYRTIERISSLRKCTTISCSYSENKESKKLNNNSLYVDNGVNVENIDKIIRSVKLSKNKKPVIFTIGRISTQKNPALFNDIAQKFSNMEFVWIGDGKLRSMLNSPNIKITGWKSIKKTLQLAVNYDMFLLTSKWEGLPISLLEAMYMKKLCIVSNVVGSNSVIVNGVNGYLCNNLDDYCNIIQKFKNGKFPNDIIENAYDDIVRHYNSKVMAAKYAEIYMKALKQK